MRFFPVPFSIPDSHSFGKPQWQSERVAVSVAERLSNARAVDVAFDIADRKPKHQSQRESERVAVDKPDRETIHEPDHLAVAVTQR